MQVLILNGDLAGVHYPLTGPVVTLGRRSDNDICVSHDPRISRQHASLTVRGHEVVLQDLGSANGTFIEQRRIYDPTPLNTGSRFRLGRTWLQLLEDSPDEVVAPGVVLVEPERVSDSSTGDNVVFALDAVRPVEPPEDAAELNRRLQAMVSLGQTLGSTLDLPSLLQLALDETMRVLPADQATLLMVSPETGEPVPRVARSRTGDVSQGDLRVSRHVVTSALRKKLAILTSDATTDARFSEADSVQDLRIRSAICAPLVAHGEAIGAIYLDAASQTHVFTEADVRLVAGIAGAVAVGLENARLYTDLRQAYDALQAAQDQLVESQSVATVGMLSASIAHDMANIVTPVHVLAQMLLKGMPLGEDARDALRNGIERLGALVQRILSFSRPSQAEVGPVDVNTVVDHTVAMVNSELSRRGITLELPLAEDVPTITGDGPQLERALLNLMLNAADALEGCAERVLTVATRVEEGEVVISVQDTGPGIPLEVQQRMFEPFFTTKATGTGLGLFSCRRIVEDEHGGNLELDSRPGAGTTISIWLPAGPRVF